jgi:hypothetical protein
MASRNSKAVMQLSLDDQERSVILGLLELIRSFRSRRKAGRSPLCEATAESGPVAEVRSALRH